ncbi:MAG: gamma-glutamyltransferase family protein [Proteobacteria bacterium]|nr:gamma-glutamyltransferase family protein [Pseudomonadota bacterium]
MTTDIYSRPAEGATGTHRPALQGTRHMVVAGHYLAAHAGFTILEAGGNAVDAGVAAGIALGVLQSDLVNIAGVAPIVVYLAARDEVVTISGLGTWPRAVTPDLFQRMHGGHIPAGVLRTVVPAAPDAWITALARYGTMSFGEVAAAAIRFAGDGFPMHRLMSDIIKTHVADYRRWPSSAAVYLPGGRPPDPGEIFVQSDLARSLRYMADQERAAATKGRLEGLEAARAAFYRGDIAAAIIKYHRENGGLLSAADLAEYRSGIEPPVRYRFAGVDVYACGPWCQGPVLPQTLSILDGIDLKGLGHNAPAYIHTLTEALKLAFADRERYYGDPRFVDVPIDRLLSAEYAAARRVMVRRDRAWSEMPPAGEVATTVAGAAPYRPTAAVGTPHSPLDTSYVCVVDRHGNAFSATPSDSSYDMPVVPGTGLCPSSRGSQSWADPKHASSVAPGKRPRLTPNPALAIAKGKTVMPFGTPGGDVQSQAMLQAFLNLIVFGMDPQAAIEAPRFATYSFPDSFEPHGYLPSRLNLEGRLPRETGAALSALGHDIAWWPDWIWKAGAMCMIRADKTTGVLTAGADPRRNSYAVGW